MILFCMHTISTLSRYDIKCYQPKASNIFCSYLPMLAIGESVSWRWKAKVDGVKLETMQPI